MGLGKFVKNTINVVGTAANKENSTIDFEVVGGSNGDQK